MRSRRIRVFAAELLGLVLGAALAAPAAMAYAPADGRFVATMACPAPAAFRTGANPGAIATEPGRTYAVRALNRADGDQVQIEVPDASPRLRWVARACGRLQLAAADADADGAAAAAAAPALPPFFDAVDAGPADPAPAPPALGPFDRAVLRACGAWASRPARRAFRDMLDDPALAADVAAIYAALDRSVFGGPVAPERFRDELTELWFRAGGFVHLFCGEPTGTELGGLHFAGRYYEMQQRGWGGLAAAAACRREVAPPVYTLGVLYRAPGGEVRLACPKGYALGLDARALLVAATRAAKRAAARGLRDGMCLSEVREAGLRPHVAVLVLDRGAVRTFYPDASPRCDRGGAARGCACG